MRTNLQNPTPAVQFQPPQPSNWRSNRGSGGYQPRPRAPKILEPQITEDPEWMNYCLRFPGKPTQEILDALHKRNEEALTNKEVSAWRCYRNPWRWVNKPNTRTQADLAFARMLVQMWHDAQKATPPAPVEAPKESVATEPATA